MVCVIRVSEHIESERRSIEKELKENVKLYRWEQDPNVYSIERFKKSRHKAFKLVQRYNVICQLACFPVTLVCFTECVLISLKRICFHIFRNSCNDL